MKFCPKLTEVQLQELYAFIKDKETQAFEVKRAQAIILLNNGIDIEIITRTTGYQRRQIFELRKIYLERGIDTIRTKRKGKPKELLTRKQIIEIKKILKEKDAPLRLGYGSKFWTTAILADYIEKTYRARYKSKTSYYLIFKRVKFTYHKPDRVYEKHDEEKVVKWRREIKPVIKKAWKDKDTVILAEDEMNLSSQTTFQKVWLTGAGVWHPPPGGRTSRPRRDPSRSCSGSPFHETAGAGPLWPVPLAGVPGRSPLLGSRPSAFRTPPAAPRQRCRSGPGAGR